MVRKLQTLKINLLLELIRGSALFLQLSIHLGQTFLQATLISLQVAAFGVLAVELLFEDLDLGVEDVILLLPFRLDRALELGVQGTEFTKLTFGGLQFCLEGLGLIAFVQQLISILLGLNN